MIRSIAVSAGTEPTASAAQEHAVEWARRFGARLRALSLWDGGLPDEGDVSRARREEVNSLVETASAKGVDADIREHGEGIRDGLLAEARGNDVLTVGVPTDGVASDDSRRPSSRRNCPSCGGPRRVSSSSRNRPQRATST